MEQSRRAEMLAYAIKMRTRGDRYTSIIHYLDQNCEDDQQVKEIVAIVDQMEKEGKIKPTVEVETNYMNYMMGGVCILLGVVLSMILWDKGYIATLPLILTGIGLFVMMNDG